MAEGQGTEIERMVALRDQGALTQKEFLTWCLRNFSTLPGIHLGLSKMKGGVWELATPDGTVWAKCYGGSFTRFDPLWRRIDAGHEIYEWRGHGKTFRQTHELVASSSSETVIRMTGTHFNRQATTRLELVGRDTYVFPVNDGIMSAQNSAGEALAYYRQHGSGGINLDPRKQVEVVVNSIGSSSPGFNIVVATSTLFLSRFYEVPV